QGEEPVVVDTRVVFKLGQWLRYVDDFDGARRRLEQAEQTAHDEGDESSLANILLNRVILECWSGDWTKASELADRMADAFAQTGVGDAASAGRTYVDAHFGRLEAVRAAVLSSSTSEPIVQAIWDRSLGLAELAAGENAAADLHLAEALAAFDRV